MAEKENKNAVEKKVKEKKPSLFSKLGSWFKSLRSEAKKVSWASAASVRKNTLIVIVCVVILSAIIGALDILLTNTISALSNIVRG